MTSRATDLPVRIGLIGLGPTGAYHLERISLRDDLRLVTACDSCADMGRAPPLFCELASSPTDVLARTDVDYVLVAAPQKMRRELVLRAIDAGKNVAVDGPPCLDSGEARSLLAASRRTGRTVCVLPSRRDGFDFRAARHMVQSERLGRIEAARIVSWAKAVPLDSSELARDEGSPTTDSGEGAFTFFAYQYVDQMLQLVGRPAKTVYARIASLPESDPTAAAFFMAIAFRDGGDGLIDVNLHSGAALQTGWTLAGATGAYCQQRIHVIEPSGEVCDVPLGPSDVPQADLYSELIEPARSEKDRLRSIREAATVMHILDAARESSGTAQVIEIREETEHDT
jgi:scyllo-inositol 2-dehydrogenase (NADP+)